MQRPTQFRPLVRLVLTASLLLTRITALASPTCPAHPIRFALYDYGVFYMQPNRGIDLDIGRELAKRSGCAFEFPVWSRVLIWAQLREGRLDMTASALQTPDRAAYAHFALYHVQKNFLVVRNNHTAQLSNGDTLMADTELHLGAVRGYRYSDVLTALIEQLRQSGRLELVADQQTLFQRFALGRYDAFFATPTSYARYLPQFQLVNKVKIIDVLPQEPPGLSGLAISKSNFSEAEAQEWRKLINDMRNDGTLRSIFRHYLSPADADAMLMLPASSL